MAKKKISNGADGTEIILCAMPSNQVSMDLIRLSRRLQGSSTKFLWDGANNYPSLVLCEGVFQDGDIAQMQTDLRIALKSVKRFDCVHVGYYISHSTNILLAAYHASPGLAKAYEVLERKLTSFNRVRRGVVPAIGIMITQYASFPPAFPTIPGATLTFECRQITMFRIDEKRDPLAYMKIEAFDLKP
jgi:hypothetical protein